MDFVIEELVGEVTGDDGLVLGGVKVLSIFH